MEEGKLSIRPIIKGIIEAKNTTEAEQFQNQVLRPILKLQHDILILSFKKHISKKKLSLEKLNSISLEKFIDKTLSNDIYYRNKIIGIILGQLTVTEFEYYLSKQSEIHKRITSMLKQRLKDTLIS